MLEARIVAVADAFDAMTSDRSYRKAMSYNQAISELEKGAGVHFEPEVVETLRDILVDEGKLT